MMTTSSSPSSWFEKVIQVLNNEPQDRGELVSLLKDAMQRNLLAADTFAMIEGAIQVSDTHVRDIMVPRAQMTVLDIDAPPQELVKIIVDSGYSRFPVISDNRDDVQGIFLAKDLLDYYAQGEGAQFTMRDVMRPAVFIPESKRLNVLLREFRTSRNHMAIVVDEYSGVAGLVTIEDVIEQIVGDIDDEHDIDDQVFIKERDNGMHTVRALTPIDEFNDYFKTNFPDDEFDTIGGLVLQAFGHLPRRGEHLELGGFKFQVVRANNRRIHLLRIEPIKKKN